MTASGRKQTTEVSYRFIGHGRTSIQGPSTYELLPSRTLAPCYGADRLELRQIRRLNWRSSENCARIAPTALKRRQLSYALLHRHTQQYPGIRERTDAD